MDINEKLFRLNYDLSNDRSRLLMELNLSFNIRTAEENRSYENLIQPSMDQISDHAWQTASAQLDERRIRSGNYGRSLFYEIDDVFQMKFPDGSVKCVFYRKDSEDWYPDLSYCISTKTNDKSVKSLKTNYESVSHIHAFRALMEHGMCRDLCQESVRFQFSLPGDCSLTETVVLFRDGHCYRLYTNYNAHTECLFREDDWRFDSLLRREIRRINSR